RSTSREIRTASFIQRGYLKANLKSIQREREPRRRPIASGGEGLSTTASCPLACQPKWLAGSPLRFPALGELRLRICPRRILAPCVVPFQPFPFAAMDSIERAACPRQYHPR